MNEPDVDVIYQQPRRVEHHPEAVQLQVLPVGRVTENKHPTDIGALTNLQGECSYRRAEEEEEIQHRSSACYQ